jgi:excisionase family DNA binding protein
MIENVYEKICNEALITTITDKVSKIIDEKLEDLRDSMSSPYVNGIDGLADYMHIGETLARKLYKTKEIRASRFGREIWFRKSDIDKFITKYKE